MAMGYRPEAELDTGRHDPAALLADVSRALAVRLELFEQTWDDPWDLWVGVITDTDRVNHFAWPALWEPEHPLAPAALDIYRQVDTHIGRLWARFGPQVEAGEIGLMLAADHSFGPIVSEVYLNQWLMAEGYLVIEGSPPHERILPATRALALDPGRIYLHWAGRFPDGSLTPGPEAQRLLGEIAGKLKALRFTRLTQGRAAPGWRARPRWPGCIWARSCTTAPRRPTPRTWWPSPRRATASGAAWTGPGYSA